MRTRASAMVGLVVFLVGIALGSVQAQDAVRTGEITKVDTAAKSLLVKTARGETQVLTTGETVIKDGDRTITLADLKVGDHVKVTGVRKEAAVEAKEILKQAQ